MHLQQIVDCPCDALFGLFIVFIAIAELEDGFSNPGLVELGEVSAHAQCHIAVVVTHLLRHAQIQHD